MQLLIIVVFCLVAFGIMLFALHFARYKKRKTGCCGGSDACGSAAGNTCEHHGTGHGHTSGECSCKSN